MGGYNLKRQTLASIILFLTLILSIFLTYISVNSYDFYNFLLTQGIEDFVEPTTTQVPANNYEISQFYNSTNVNLEDVMRPQGYYFHRDGEFFWFDQANVRQTITAYFSSRPIELRDQPDIFSEEELYYINSMPYLEIKFNETLPIGLFSNYFEHDEAEIGELTFDRLFIPFEESHYIYLINSSTEEAIRAEMEDELAKQELEALISEKLSEAIPVRRYISQKGFIYLPIESIKKESRLFTIEELPDSLFISNMFQGNSEPQIVSTNNTSTIYRNYRYSLEINNVNKRLDFMVSRIDEGQESNLVEGILSSFEMIKQYDYWPGDIRLTKRESGRIFYRHYLEGLPIHTHPSLPEYGSSIVHLRNDKSYEISRFQASLLIPEAYIEGINQSYNLETDFEIIDYLSYLGIGIEYFSNVFIGYEWQPDMEDFQKMILVPKWFLTFEDKYYALDDLDSPEFRNHFETVRQLREGGE